jgi:hypothetical protein
MSAEPDGEDAVDIYRGITVGSTKADVLAAFPEIGPAEQRVKALWHDDYTAGVRVGFYLDDGETVIRAETEELPPEFENRSDERQLADYPAETEELPPEFESRSYERQLTDYLAALFDEAYSPYYDGLRYELSNYAQTFDDGGYAATFFWTMYHRDSGGDVSADSGRETYGNFSLLATAKTADGKIDFQTLSVLGDISVTGTRDYAAPLEDYFPGEQSALTLTGYIRSIDVHSLTLGFDRVYFLGTPTNDEFLKELGVDPKELSNGFYIYDPEEEVYRYDISDAAVFDVFEIPEGEAWRLMETDIATLARELNTRTNLYTIVVNNGAITRVSERYVP